MGDHAAETKTPLLNAKRRIYLYRILLAAQPLAVAYGLVTHDMSVLWVNFGAAVITGGVALKHITPDAKD